MKRFDNWPLPAALALGALMPWAFSPYDLRVLALLALAGWAWLLLQHPGRTLAIGWAFGLGWFGTGAWWLADTFTTYGALPVPLAWACVGLVGLALGLFPACWGWASIRISGSPRAFALAFPLIGAGEEWLRGHLFTGLPWTALGNLLLDTPAVGWLAVIGAYAAAALPALFAVGLVLLFKKDWPPAAASLALAIGLTLLAPSPYPANGTAWRVALIQPDIPQDQKWNPAALRHQMSILDQLSQRALPVDTLIWPEAAVPFFWEQSPPWSKRIEDLAQAVHSDFLFGGVRRLKSDASAVQNGLYLIASGRQTAFSAKRHLVPFGEYVPTWLPWLHKLVPDIGNFVAGTGKGVIHGDHARYGSLICYESIFPEEARARVRNGANVLVVVTNDAWYGTSPAAWQHLQASRARAVETGRYVLRAANTGVSAIIAPDGRLEATMPWWTRGFVRGTYRISEVQTPYVRFGDLPVMLMMLAGGLMLVWRKTR